MQNDTVFLKSILKAKNEDGFRLKTEETDELGITHKKFQQYYKGIKVENAEYLVHGKNGEIEVINGDFQPINIENVNPVYSERQALGKALEYVGAEKYKWEDPDMEKFIKLHRNNIGATYYPKGELVIAYDYLTGSDSFKLSWKFTISSLIPNNEQFVFVDAVNGGIVLDVPLILKANTSGTALTRYSTTKTIICDSYTGGYRLYENRGTTSGKSAEIHTRNCLNTTNWGSAIEFSNSSTSWTSGWAGFTQHQAALDAHWAAEQVLDYLSTVHSRNSLNHPSSTTGLPILLYVHYGTNYIAGWDQTNKIVYLGDGNTNYNPLTSLDVVAHEMGHGLMQYTANLYYPSSKWPESAALHEGFSDIWAACVVSWAAPNKSKWLIGDEIQRPPNNFQCMRNLINPRSNLSSEGPNPSRYKGTHWDNNNEPHMNSTVLSHWFYLLSEGGSGNNDGIAFDVLSIGINKAEKIVMKTLLSYLYSSADYTAARNATISAAEYLYGSGSIEVYSVKNAWYAVGVGSSEPVVITGASLVPCSGNVTYSVPPGGSSYTWTYTNLSYVSGGSGSNTLTVKKDAGSTSQGASVSVVCNYNGNSRTLSKTVNVGVPRITSLTPSGTTNITTGSSVNFIASPSLSWSQGSYEWVVSPTSGVYQSKYENTNYITFNNEGYYPVSVRTYMSTAQGHACNITGTTYTTSYVYVSPYSPSSSPPQSSRWSSIQIDNKTVTVLFDPSFSTTRQSFTWRLYNLRTSALMASGQIASIGGTLYFSHLPDDLYILQIDMDNSSPETHKISLQ